MKLVRIIETSYKALVRASRTKGIVMEMVAVFQIRLNHMIGHRSYLS